MEFNSYAAALETARRIGADVGMIQTITYGFGRQVWQVLIVEDDRWIAYGGQE